MIPNYLTRLRAIETNSLFMGRLINLVIFVLLLCELIFFLQILSSLFGKRKQFSYEKITKTQNESTIAVNIELQEK